MHIEYFHIDSFFDISGVTDVCNQFSDVCIHNSRFAVH